MTEPQKLRLFLAMDVPRPHLEAIADAVVPLRELLPDARWTPVENQHITLKFLGWVPDDRLEAVAGVCESVSSRHSSAELALSELGAFPTPRRVRVLWVGVEDAAGALRSLAGDLDEALEPLGFEREARDFTAHLTLARSRTPRKVPDGLPALGIGPLGFDVGELVLYRSHLSPRGPRYEALRTFPLAPAGGPEGDGEIDT